MVEPPSWKNMSQNGNVPQIGMNITNIWNHQLVYLGYLLHLRHPCRGFLQPMLLVDMTTRGFTWSIHPWPNKFGFSRPSIVIIWRLISRVNCAENSVVTLHVQEIFSGVLFEDFLKWNLPERVLYANLFLASMSIFIYMHRTQTPQKNRITEPIQIKVHGSCHWTRTSSGEQRHRRNLQDMRCISSILPAKQTWDLTLSKNPWISAEKEPFRKVHTLKNEHFFSRCT